MRILVLGAHQDDVAMGCGALIATLAEAGYEIMVVAATSMSDPTARKNRNEEERLAMETLGVKSINLNFNDGKLSNHLKSLRKKMANIAKSFQPNVVVSHWAVDVHPDHRVLAAASFEPFFQFGINVDFYAYESSSEIGRPQSLGFTPTHYFPVNNQKAITKRDSMSAYASQGGGSKLWDCVEETHYTRGAEAGYKRAEAFVRLTRAGDPLLDLQAYQGATQARNPVKIDRKKINI